MITLPDLKRRLLLDLVQLRAARDYFRPLQNISAKKTATLVYCVASAAFGATLHATPASSLAAADLGPRASVPINLPPARLQESDPGDLPGTHILAEHRCLTEMMYFEARGEGKAGEKAVAEVAFNRLSSGDHGHSLCSVIYEGVDSPVCQFSFACDPHRTADVTSPVWRNTEKLAAQILTGEEPLGDNTEGATYYHAASIQPYWIAALSRTVQIGDHIFYKQDPARRKFQVLNLGRPAIRGAL